MSWLLAGIGTTLEWGRDRLGGLAQVDRGWLVGDRWYEFFKIPGYGNRVRGGNGKRVAHYCCMNFRELPFGRVPMEGRRLMGEPWVIMMERVSEICWYRMTEMNK